MWYPIKKLQEVCEKITDGTHQTPTYFNKWVIFLSSKNVTTWKIDWNNVKYIDEKQHIEMSKRITPQKWDILLAKNWTTWIWAIVDKEEIFDIYVSLALLRPTEIINWEYLLYFINSSLAKTQFNSRLKWVWVPNLHLKEIKEVLIPIALVPTQKLIVQKLDSSFEKIEKSIELTKKNLENIEELNKSVLDNIFNEWEFDEEIFWEICDFVRWPFWWSLKKEIFKESWYAVYEQMHAIWDQYEEIRYFIDEEKFNEMKRFELSSWNLIMSCSGTMWKVSIVPEWIKKWIINQALLTLKPSSKLLNKYLKLYMESWVFQEEITKYSKWAAIKNVASVKILKQIKIPLPPLEKQKEIVLHLDQVFEKNRVLKQKYENKLKDLEEMKQSLLKEAFEWRLVKE